MSDDLTELSADLRRLSRSVGRQARGITAAALDQAAERAKAAARSQWRVTGERSDPAINSIRPRMSRTVGARGGRVQEGYLLVDSPGGVFERGGGHTPPKPALGPAVESVLPWLGDKFTRELGLERSRPRP